MEMIAISSNSLTLNSIRSGDYYINMSGISTNPNPYSDKSRYTYGIEIPFMPGSTKDNTVVSNDGLVAVFLNDVIEICDLFSKGSKDYSAYSPKNMESHANPAFEMRFLVRPDSAKTGLKAIRNIVMMDGSKIISRDDGYSASYTENDRTDNISSTDDYDISLPFKSYYHTKIYNGKITGISTKQTSVFVSNEDNTEGYLFTDYSSDPIILTITGAVNDGFGSADLVII